MFAAAVPAPSINADFARDVQAGLQRKNQKTIPASWLYDDVGSSLFETITLLPEYGLTRADAALLKRAAPAIIRESGHPSLIIELGSGTGTKTRHILNAAMTAASPLSGIAYRPIDISASALDGCEAALGGVEGIQIEPIQSTYMDGLQEALRSRGSGPAMILFLGSTIGNFDRPEASRFLSGIRGRLRAGDTLLLGADLVKPAATLIQAYDDPIGVTAAFNLNLLARINRELDGQFAIDRFRHEARFNERASRVEMHLRSLIAQTVRIDGLGITVPFERDETIWTESSHKFTAESVCRMGERTGWTCARQWLDDSWGFSETLFVAKNRR